MSLINFKANQELKALGCKWDGSTWVAPKLAKKEADAINNKFYNNMIVVEITVKGKLKGADFSYNHVRTVAGYIVASSSGRDSGARIYNGVAVIDGKFYSGGSIKNFMCEHTDDMVLRLEVSKNALDILDEEVKEGRYEYRILEEIKSSYEDLIKEKEELLAKIKEIDKILSLSKNN